MTSIQFLTDWALRSTVLILAGALVLWALRVKVAAIRLAAWTAMLLGSLAIPALTVALPELSFSVMRATPVAALPAVHDAAPVASAASRVEFSRPFNWARAALILYIVVAFVLLVRILTGLAMSIRLRRRSRATGQSSEGIEIRESESIESPIALGIVRPAILLPSDWNRWESAKLEAVLAHERSHIRRHDPAVQVLSAIHRALLWISPASWFLHQRLVRVAEEASDDAAALTCDRALYAKVLLEFMQRGLRSANWAGVPMARYGRPDQRIDRILEGKAVPGQVTRWSVATILALGLPLACLAAVARPVKAQQKVSPAPETVSPKVESRTVAFAQQETGSSYVPGLGAVTAYTVTVKPRVDGQLMSVNFQEGDTVQTGQILATIDPSPYENQLVQAQWHVATDEAHLAELKQNQQNPASPNQLAEVEGTVKVDRAKFDQAKLQLAYTRIASPITGVAGLRRVDAGNIVHAADPDGIVVINQLQPISVLFTIPEDRLPQVLARINGGASLTAEAWNRPSTSRIATGRVIAVDNQIDTSTGMVKVKAEFPNKDGALFPNQFVNVHLLLK